LLGFDVAFSFLEFQCETVFPVSCVFSVLCFAVVACVGLDCELSVFPCFVEFGVFFFAVWTLSHNYHSFFVCVVLKDFMLWFVLGFCFLLDLLLYY